MSKTKAQRSPLLFNAFCAFLVVLVSMWLPTACGPQKTTGPVYEASPRTDAGQRDTKATTPDKAARDTAAKDTGNQLADQGQAPDNGPRDTGQPPSDAGTLDQSAQDTGTADDAPQDQGAPEKSKTVKEIPAGNVSGNWCGRYRIKGTITIAKGKSLTVCAGSELAFERSAGLTIIGLLKLNGTKSERIVLKATSSLWQGAQATGIFDGKYFDIEQGKICIFGRADSSVKVSFGRLLKCDRAFRLDNGGTFTKSIIKGGNSTQLKGGTLTMTDSIIDLEEPKTGPDCIKIDTGGIQLDHVRFTGCHCPLHINATSQAIKVTNSIFDGATYPMMIAQSKGTFTNNHFIQGTAHVLDIGGGIDVNMANNYWDGKTPKIQSGNASQFKGTNKFLKTPVPNVGPR